MGDKISKAFKKHQNLILIRRILVVFATVLWSGSVLSEEVSKVGLALSGGAAKGLAHIGVLQAFEELEIPIDMIAGSSAGAMVGGAYAAGISVSEMKEQAESGRYADIFMNRKDPGAVPIEYRYDRIPSQLNILIDENQIVNPLALLSDEALNDFLYIETASGNARAGGDFDSLAIPFAAATSDVLGEKIRILHKGPLWRAVRASMAYPLAYAPVFMDSSVYMDGGVYDNLPINALREMGADIVIAVNVADAPPEGSEIEDIEDIFALLSNVLAPPSDSANVSGWDHFVQVDTRGYSLIDFESASEIVELGYREGLKAGLRIKHAVGGGRDVAAFHRKQEKYRGFLEAKVLAGIDLKGNSAYPDEYVLQLVDSRIGEAYCPERFYRDIIRLKTSGLFEDVVPEFNYDRDSDVLRISLMLKDAVPRELQAGMFYDSDGGVNFFIDQVFKNISGGKFNISNRIFLGNHYQGIHPRVHLFNFYSLPFINLRFSSALSASYSRRHYNTNIDGMGRSAMSKLDLFWSGITAIGWNSMMDISLHLKRGALLDPVDNTLRPISGLRQDSFYFVQENEFISSEINRTAPIDEGYKSRLSLSYGKNFTQKDLIGNVEDLEESFLRLETDIYYGFQPIRSFAVYGNLVAFGTGGVLPLGEFDPIPTSEARLFTLEPYFLARHGAALQLSIANRVLNNDLWLHLRGHWNYFKSHDPENMAIENVHRVEAADIFFRYQTILGPVSYGISAMHYSDEWSILSWARVGFKF